MIGNTFFVHSGVFTVTLTWAVSLPSSVVTETLVLPVSEVTKLSPRIAATVVSLLVRVKVLLVAVVGVNIKFGTTVSPKLTTVSDAEIEMSGVTTREIQLSNTAKSRGFKVPLGEVGKGIFPTAESGLDKRFKAEAP